MKVNWFSQRSLHFFHLLLPFLCHEVAANTEIINFSSSQERTVDLPRVVVGNWSKLNPSDNEQRWTLKLAELHTPLHQVCERRDNGDSSSSSSGPPPFSCPHEQWVFLDLDDAKWVSYSTFTLRLSWPASTPADMAITLYSPQDVLARLSYTEPVAMETTHARSFSTSHPTTRSRYARIRAVDAGVPIPGSRSYSLPRFHPPLPPRPRVPVIIPIYPPGGSSSSDEAPARPDGAHLAAISAGVAERGGKEDEGRETRTVEFVVILEPLHLGVLPASLLPTIYFLVPIVLGAALSVAHVTAYLDPFVRQAREDAITGFATAKKEQ